MASFFPQSFRDIDTIRLNSISIINPNNTIPSTGAVLTVSSGKAYMLSLTTALEAIGISSLSTQLGAGVSNWANYAATSTVNVAGFGIQGVNFLKFTNATANTQYATAEGFGTTASGVAAHSEGNGSRAEGAAAHAEGVFTIASGNGAHAEGFNATASGALSHVEGSSNLASGSNAHAQGQNTTASGTNSHAEGNRTTASGSGSHAEGFITNAISEGAHAEGNSTTASGFYSHAEGLLTNATGNFSHAEGNRTTASGGMSHAEGLQTTASFQSGHAEGEYTIASGLGSHAEGYYCIAQGYYGHAQGWYSEANANWACFASGVSSIASNYADTVIGYGGRSRLATNFVLGSGPVLSNGNPIYGAVQRTAFNLTTSNTANALNTYQSFPLKYYTDFFPNTQSNIPFVTLAGNKPVAMQHSVKLTGYQQPVSMADNDGTGVFFGEYTFLTYLDSYSNPTLVMSDGTVASGPFANSNLPYDKRINMFSGGPFVLDPNPTRLFADIYSVIGGFALVLKVNTASISKANWIAQVERSEIALPY